MKHQPVSGDALELTSRNYQNNTFDNVTNILFSNDPQNPYNKYAAVIFPTGGGKTYEALGLTQYMSQIGYKANPNSSNKKLRVLFVSPTTAVNDQFTNKAKSLLKNSMENIEIQTVCYASDNADKKDFSGYDLVIFDEVHRSSADTWNNLVQKIIEQNPNAKFLAMTATPERSDSNIPLDEIAQYIYHDIPETKYPIPNRSQYLAAEIYLEDALRDGISVTPKNFDWDSSLLDTPDCQEYFNSLSIQINLINNKDLSDDEKTRQKAELVRDVVETVCGKDNNFSDGTILEMYKSISNLNLFCLRVNDKKSDNKLDNKLDLNGPVIREYMMLSHKLSKLPEEDKKTAKEIEKKLSEIENLEYPEDKKTLKNLKQFRGLFSKLQDSRISLLGNSLKGLDDGILIATIDDYGGIIQAQYKENEQYIESEKARIEYELKQANRDIVVVFHSVSTKEELKKVEKLRDDDKKLGRKVVRVILTKEFLDEGIHLEGVKGVLMYSKTNTEIKFSQRTGRTIDSLGKNGVEVDENGEIVGARVVDFAGNRYTYLTQNYAEKYSPEYDLTKLNEIEDWINTNNKIPNINEIYNNGANDEIRYGLILKQLSIRYQGITNYSSNPAITSIVSKLQGIEKQYNLKLSHMQRTNTPSEEELLGKNFFKLSPFQDKVKDYASIKDEISQENRIKKLFNIISILKKYKPDLELPEGVAFNYVDSKGKIQTIDDSKGRDLEELLIQNFSEEERKLIIRDLTQYMNADPEFNIDFQNKNETVLRIKNGQLEKYDLGKELAYVRGLFLTSGTQKELQKAEKKNQKSQGKLQESYSPVITHYSLETLKNMGVIQIILKPNNSNPKMKTAILCNLANSWYSSAFPEESNKVIDAHHRSGPVHWYSNGQVDEEGFIRNENLFSFARNCRKNSSSVGFLGVSPEFNKYSVITGIEYGPKGCDRDGNMSPELLLARKFVSEYIKQASLNENDNSKAFKETLRIVLNGDERFSDSDGNLVQEDEAKKYIEKCLVNSMKYHKQVFLDKDSRPGFEFEGLDNLFNSSLSTSKGQAVDYFASCFPQFKEKYVEHLQERVNEFQRKVQSTSLIPPAIKKINNDNFGKYKKLQEYLNGDGRDD